MAEQPSENIAAFLEKVSETFGFDGNPKPFMEGQLFFLKKETKTKTNPKTFNKKCIFLSKKDLARRVVFTSVGFHLS